MFGKYCAGVYRCRMRKGLVGRMLCYRRGVSSQTAKEGFVVEGVKEELNWNISVQQFGTISKCSWISEYVATRSRSVLLGCRGGCAEFLSKVLS